MHLNSVEKKIRGRGACILINKALSYSTIELNQYCHDKTLEMCTIKLHLKSFKLIVLCVYRAPTGDINLFFKQLEMILSKIIQSHGTLVVCGDLNINFLKNSNAASELLSLMNSRNLTQAANFPTRKTNNEGTLIDVIFIDTTKYDQIQIKPIINGLSDHDAQIIYLNKINSKSQPKFPKKKVRTLNEHTISHCLSYLKEESWNQIYNISFINGKFNSFHDTLLRHYETSFPDMYMQRGPMKNNWITKGIKISCGKKREL